MYRLHIHRLAFGWTAEVSWHADDDSIGIGGLTFWRPTERWVTARAERHIARRLQAHAREAQGVTRTYPTSKPESS